MLKAFKWYFSFLKVETTLRPPGAINEKDFLRKCIRCNKCIQICPHDSIKVAKTEYGIEIGSPVIYPREIPCYVCMKCPPICPTGALDDEVIEKEQIKMGTAKLNEDACLPFSGIICKACFKNCPIYNKAIILEDELYPKVIEEYCIGCGICEHVCPIDNSAIKIEPHEKIHNG